MRNHKPGSFPFSLGFRVAFLGELRGGDGVLEQFIGHLVPVGLQDVLEAVGEDLFLLLLHHGWGSNEFTCCWILVNALVNGVE